MRLALASALLVVALVAGCFGGSLPSPGVEAPTGPDLVDGLLPFRIDVPDVGLLSGAAAAGAWSTFYLADHKDVNVEIPWGVFWFQDHAFQAERTFKVPGGQEFTLLVPPTMTNLTLKLNGVAVKVPTPDTGRYIFDAKDIIDWYKVQRDHFQRRSPGMPNYTKSQTYFADLFRSFGLTNVEVDPYGMNAQQRTATFANVVATRYAKTDVNHLRWIGMGGHYDMVTGTVEAAFDDTAGTLTTLLLAKLFANITTSDNLVFGLWGGEESGLLGSAFWSKTNPNVVAQMKMYINFDMDAFSWPAPLPVALDGSTPDCSVPSPKDRTGNAAFYCPDPILVTAGPDGPPGDSVLGLYELLQHDLLAYPDAYFRYEPVGEGQLALTGATEGTGINAQSDHSSFIAAGVPAFMFINGNPETTRPGYHNKADTLLNYTKYMLRNNYWDPEEEFSDAELAQGEALMMKSFETYVWLSIYSILFLDLGLYDIVMPSAPMQN